MLKIIIVLLLSINYLLANNLVISKEHQIFNDFQIEMFEDKNNSLSLNEIQSKEFTQVSNRISTGYSNSSFWFKLQLLNKTDKELDYFFEVTERFIHEVDFYSISSNEKIIKYEKGAGRYNEDGVVENINPLFPINLKAGEQKEIYIRLFSLYANYSSFKIIDTPALNQYTLKHNGLLSLYFGAALALIFYNLFIFFFTRDRSYLIYTFYVTSFTLWQLSLNGFPPFQTSSSVFLGYTTASFIPLVVAFQIIFSQKILNTKELFPTIDKVLKYTSYIFFIFAITSLFELRISYAILNTLTSLVFPFLLYLGFKSYFKGNKTALFYIVAQVPFLMASTIYSLMADGYIGYNLVTRQGIVVGSFLEILLFSLALGYRLKVLQQEKILLLNQTKEELAELVDLQTLKLHESNLELKHLVVTDRLTNIHNRHGLDQVLDYELTQLRRVHKYFGIILIDIDFFKKINDTYGHQMGDTVLQEFAKVLKSNMRESDTLGRWGGEEFLIICPNSNEEGLIYFAQTLRESIKNHHFEGISPQTASFGAAMSENNETNQSILKKVDTALYEAKDRGRDRVIFK